MRRCALAVFFFLASLASLSAQAEPGSLPPEVRAKTEQLLREGSTLLPLLKANLAYRERQMQSRLTRIAEREAALTQSESDLAARQSALEQRENDLAMREKNLIEREQSQERIEKALIDSRKSFETVSRSLQKKDLELWITRGTAVAGIAFGIYGLIRANEE